MVIPITMLFLLQLGLVSIFFVVSSECYIQGPYDVPDVIAKSNFTWDRSFESAGISTLPLLKHGNKLYYMGLHTRVDFNAALHLCETMHMNLLTIHSQAEHERIQKYVRDAGPSYTQFWIGGTRIIDGVKWIWMPYGSEVDYNKWGPNYPVADTNQNCIFVHYAANELVWRNLWCNWGLPFICEKYINPDQNGFTTII